MSFQNTPIPAAAEAAGMTNLAFAEDFETDKAIDFSGEGRPGYSFYADRPYDLPTLTPEDCQMRDSILYFKPEECPAAIGLVTYSVKGDTGFTMKRGYAEARIRADLPTGKYNGVPAFWGMEKVDMLGERWERIGELDILEINEPAERPNTQMHTGALHEHHRTGKIKEDGREERLFATNWINYKGYNDDLTLIDDNWHTYAALWDDGYIAWYFDGQLLHAVRFDGVGMPTFYHKDDPTPLPCDENTNTRAGWGYVWPGAYKVFDTAEEILVLGCNKNWPMEVDWVRVWTK